MFQVQKSLSKFSMCLIKLIFIKVYFTLTSAHMFSLQKQIGNTLISVKKKKLSRQKLYNVV